MGKERLEVNLFDCQLKLLRIFSLRGKRLNKTISEGLKPYELGEKLRGLRLKKSMGLVELGRHTGLSPAMLSKLERGKLFPTLPTLLRIAMVFSVGLDYFFTNERKRRVVAIVRKKDRIRFPERPGSSDNSYWFESLDFAANERRLNAFLAEFQAIKSEKLRLHHHNGVEFLYMMQGQIELTIGSETFVLDSGDAIYFDSGVRHGYRLIGRRRSTAVIVTTS